jgi:glutathione S-transferase
MKEIVLYYAPDNASLIIRILLEELGLEYTDVLVDRSVAEQHSQAYLSLNPTGLIPACVIDGQTIAETAAIALYIGESNSTTMVVPPGHQSRSDFLRWLFFMANTVHPDLRQLFYADKFVGNDEQKQVEFRKMVRQRLHNSLSILDSLYAQQSGSYLFSDEPCVIDIYLALSLRWQQLYPSLERGTFKLSAFPALESMVQALQSRSAVIKACAVEGISGDFFSRAEPANPPVGSAL